MAAPANRYTHELDYGAADHHHHTCIPEVSSPWTTRRGLPSVVLITAPAVVWHPRAAAGVLHRWGHAELSQQCCLSCQTGCYTAASEILAGALAMANLSSHTSQLPVPPLQLFSSLDWEAAVKGCPRLSSPFSSCQALRGAPLPPEDPQIQSSHDSIPPPPAATRAAFCPRVGPALCVTEANGLCYQVILAVRIVLQIQGEGFVLPVTATQKC